MEHWNDALPFAPVAADECLAAAVAAYDRRYREFLQEFEPQRGPKHFTEEGQRELLRRSAQRRQEGQEYRFFLRQNDGTVIGLIALSNVVWGGFHSAFLGYQLDQAHRNRGYMTAAVAWITTYAFEELGLHRIEGNVMPRNGASLRVLEKNGYQNEGISPAYMKINGKWEDHVHMVRRNLAMER